MSNTSFYLRCLGPMKLLRAGREVSLPARASRLLLALFLLRRGQALSRLEIQTTLWPEATAQSSSRALRQALWKLRATFEESPVSSEGATLTLNALWLESDVEAFLQAAQQDPLKAINLYTGEFLQGEDHPWALEERETLLEGWKGLFETGVAQLERQRNWPALLECCETALVRVPNFELAQQTRLLALRNLSRRAEAGREQSRLEGQLERELDLPPPSRPPILEIPPIFVGRHPEKRQLQASLEAAKKGRGKLVRLEGEAGSGKSRLLEEFAHSALERGFEVYWVRGPSGDAFQSLDRTLSQTLSPLRLEWLRLRLDLRSRQTVARALPSLARLAERGLAEGQSESLAPPPTLTPLFAALSETGPQVWVWDSLEALDAVTLEQLPAWAEGVSHSPSLWVMSYRIEENAHSPAFKRTLERLDSLNIQRLTLKVLEHSAVGEWTELALGAVPDGWTSALHRVAAGLPELIALCLQEEQNHPNQPLLPLDLPESCNTVLEHRISALAPELKSWLQGVAVWGQSFTFADFPAWSDLGAANLLTLERLINRGWIFSENSAYSLTSSRLRQVLLSGLERVQKRSLHARAARFLEKSSLEYGQICDHFAQANEWEEVARVVPEAAQQALAHSKVEAARHFLDLALSPRITSHLNLETLQNLTLERIKLCERQGDLEQAFEDVDALERLASPNSEAKLRAQLERTRLEARYRPEQQPEKTLERILEFATERGFQEQRAEALMQMGSLCSQAGRLGEALEQHREALELFVKLGLRGRQTQAWREVGVTLMRLSRNVEALEALAQALEGFRALENRAGQAEALYVLGTLGYRQAHYREAESHFSEALTLEDALNNPFGAARNRGSLALIQALNFRLLEARSSLEGVLAYYLSTSSVPGEIEFRLRLATLQVEMMGDWEAARPHLERCLAGVEKYSLEWARATSLTLWMALEQQDWAGAESLLEDWERGTVEDPGARAWPTLFRVKMARLRGRLKEARAYLTAVHSEALAELTYQFELEQIRLNLLERQAEKALEQVQKLDQEAEAQGLQELYALSFEALIQMGRETEARADLERRYEVLERALNGLTFLERGQALGRVELWRELHNAWTTYLSVQRTVDLPRQNVPLGQPLTPDNLIAVTLTLESPTDRYILKKDERRRVQLERLFMQAEQAGVRLTLSHLAELLGVSRMTVRRDLQKASKQGLLLNLRGHSGPD